MGWFSVARWVRGCGCGGREAYRSAVEPRGAVPVSAAAVATVVVACWNNNPEYGGRCCAADVDTEVVLWIVVAEGGRKLWGSGLGEVVWSDCRVVWVAETLAVLRPPLALALPPASDCTDCTSRGVVMGDTSVNACCVERSDDSQSRQKQTPSQKHPSRRNAGRAQH